MKLLRAHLTPSQKKTLKTKRWIEVKGSETGNVYRIDCTLVTGNITNRKTGKQYCVVVEEGIFNRWDALPNGDHLLAQKLIIETNEKKFRRIAFRVG